MKMRVDELKMRVRAKIDELGPNDSDMIDIDKDNKELDRIIKDCALGALQYLLMNADVSKLDCKEENPPASISSENVAVVQLPDDCLRVVSVRLSSWRSSATDIVTENSPAYLMQADPYACGTPERPVAALVHPGGKRSLELYKASKQGDSCTLHYVAVPVYDSSVLGDESVEVPMLLEHAFVYHVASLVMQAYGENGTALAETAKQLAGI